MAATIVHLRACPIPRQSVDHLLLLRLGNLLYDLRRIQGFCWSARLPIHPRSLRGIDQSMYDDHREYVVDST